MSEEKKMRLFDKITSESDKVFDEKMLPLIEQEMRANFESERREGQKLKLSYEKKIWIDLIANVEDFDIDGMSNLKWEIEKIDKKIKFIEEMYEELFNEKMA